LALSCCWLNATTAAQPEQLPGIGPAKAKAIVADREANGPFSSMDNVMRVGGIRTGILENVSGAEHEDIRNSFESSCTTLRSLEKSRLDLGGYAWRPCLGRVVLLLCSTDHDPQIRTVLISGSQDCGSVLGSKLIGRKVT